MDNEILSEFSIPAGEIDAPIQTGDIGDLRITVEVISQVNGLVGFRKRKKAVVEGNFKPEGAKDMRERLLAKQDETESETPTDKSPKE